MYAHIHTYLKHTYIKAVSEPRQPEAKCSEDSRWRPTQGQRNHALVLGIFAIIRVDNCYAHFWKLYAMGLLINSTHQIGTFMIIYIASGHSAKYESSVTVYKMEQQHLSTPIKISAVKCL